MNKYLKYTLFFLALTILSCTEKFQVSDIPNLVVPSIKEYYFQVDPRDLYFAADGSTNDYYQRTTIYVTSSGAWEFKDIPEWVLISKTQGVAGSSSVPVSAAENMSFNSRMATFEITHPKNEDGWSAYYVMTASQNAASPYIKTSTTNLSFNGESSTQSVDISSNVPFKIKEDYGYEEISWFSCSINADSTEISIKVEPNASSSSRNGRVYLTYSGAGGSTEETIYIYQVKANINITSSTELDVPAGKSTAIVEFSAEADWMATTDSDFIQFIYNGSTVDTVHGTAGNNCTFAIDIAPNPNTYTRDGQVYITIVDGKSNGNSQSIRISQEGINLHIDNYNLEFNTSMQESQTVNIESNSDWTATIEDAEDDWIQISPQSGSGNGTITITANDNPSSSRRSGYVKVVCHNTYKSISVYQSGKAIELITPSSGSITFGASSANDNITFSTNGKWSAQSNVEWITVSSANGEPGNSITLPISIAFNKDSVYRSGKVTISAGEVNKSINIYQETRDIIYSNGTIEMGPNADTASVIFRTNKSWKAKITTQAEWITISPGSGSAEAATIKDYEIKAIVTDNKGDEPREATLEISSTDNSDKNEIVIKQYNSSITVNTDSLAIGPAAQQKDIYIRSNTPWTANVEESAKGWLSVSPEQGGTNSSSMNGEYVSAKVTENTENIDKSGDIIITTSKEVKIVHVTQSRRYFEISSNAALDFTANGGTCIVSVTKATDNWEVIADVDWISCSPSSGSGKRDIHITAKTNNSRNGRKGTVTIQNNYGNSYKIELTQKGRDIAVNENGIELFAKGGEINTTIQADGEFTITTNDTWYEVSRKQGTNTLIFNLPENETGVARTGSVVVTLTGQPADEEVLTKTIKVTQHPYMNNIDLSDYIGKEMGQKVVLGDGFKIVITTYTSDKNYNKQDGSVDTSVNGYDKDKGKDKNGNGNVTINGYGDDKNWNTQQ